MWQWQTLESLLVDLKHICRRLRRSPGFAITVLLTLAIGIGANTAVFSVLNSVLLRPLPYPEPQQLVSLHLNAPGAPGPRRISERAAPLGLDVFHLCPRTTAAFQSLGVWGPGTASITGIAQPEQVNTATDFERRSRNAQCSCLRWPMAHSRRSGSTRAGTGDVELWLLAAPLRRRPKRRRPHHQRQFTAASNCRRHAARIQDRELRLRSAGSAGLRSGQGDAGRLWLSRHRAPPARGHNSAGERRRRAPAQRLDGLVDERSGQRSALVSTSGRSRRPCSP